MRNIETFSIDISAFGLANNWFPPALMPRPHRHNEVELNFIERGSMTYLFGGVRVRVNAGRVALFWATVPHQIIAAEEQPVLHWVTVPFVTFLQWQLPEVLTHQVICGHFVMSREEDTQNTQHQVDQVSFRQWYTDFQQNTDEHRKIVLLEVEARLRRLALSMLTSQTPSRSQLENRTIRSKSEPSKVEHIACFIAEHYTESLSVARIAQIVHLHPNYAITLFRKSFGMSIVDYITQYRVSHAQRLLVTTNANISAIALESGFGSVSRFYIAFNEACGQSPAAFRASVRGVSEPHKPHKPHKPYK
jgi:AraC family transcriptional regulator, melibiose operon regulatory protein